MFSSSSVSVLFTVFLLFPNVFSVTLDDCTTPKDDSIAVSCFNVLKSAYKWPSSTSMQFYRQAFKDIVKNNNGADVPFEMGFGENSYLSFGQTNPLLTPISPPSNGGFGSFGTDSVDFTPTSQDWRRISNPIKNQGGCDSCWAFTGTAAVEYAYSIYMTAKTKRKTPAPDLSEQFAMNDFGTAHCNGGGNTDSVLSGATSIGIPDNSYLPYQDKDVKIPSNLKKGKFKGVKTIGSYSSTAQVDYKALAKMVFKQPVAINILVKSELFHYKSGIYDPAKSKCPKNSYNHAMLVVGYDLNKKYWIVRNSWGTSWGENGYARIKMIEDNNGACNMYGYVVAPPLNFDSNMKP